MLFSKAWQRRPWWCATWCHFRPAHHLGEEFGPENLAIALLISPAFPFLGEGSGSHALLFLCLHLVFLTDTKIAIKNKVSKRSWIKISLSALHRASCQRKNVYLHSNPLPILLSFYDNHFMIIQTKVVSLHPYCDVRSYKKIVLWD